jgi:hypothetical protein
MRGQSSITPSMFSGHGMPRPYDGKGNAGLPAYSSAKV